VKPWDCAQTDIEGEPRSGDRTGVAMAHTFTNLLFHVIFGTKGHDPSIDADLRGALHAYVGGIVGEFKGIALSVNGTADHLHALIKIPPTMAIAEALRLIKTNSSKWAHEKGARNFSWQSGYAAFSVSESGGLRTHVHRTAGGTSPRKDFSGRVSGVPA
jgi:putative transposase